MKVNLDPDEMIRRIRELRAALVALFEAKGEQKMADALLQVQIAMFNSSDYSA